ncbi:hypothetical protein OG535_26915 [Kitasatospora sp. NBC_00085]|uniref:hypothetical protein n=1 Tax=unclassified Kitasatospora TaxID=2633591 RepID=UPI003250ECBE
MTTPTTTTLWARRVTDGVEPKNVIIAMLPLPGVLRYGWRGLGWALFAVLFAAVVPTLFIRRGVRKGTLDDRHVGHRQRRLTVFPFIVTPPPAGAGGFSLALVGVATGQPGP